MTDLLLKPEDTGEIPTGPVFDPDNPGTHAWDCDCDVCLAAESPTPGEKTVRIVGERTANLAPYVNGLGPVLRRPTVETPTLAPEGSCRRIVPNDEDFGPAAPPPPSPLPPTPQPPKPAVDEVVWDYADPSETYMGKHRRPSRWDWLTVPLAMAVQRIVGAV